MREQRSGVRRAEKISGVVAVIAALVVLNGAWVNQHNWQNISWRVATAAVLGLLAIVVETNAFGMLQARTSGEAEIVPAFMRTGEHATVSDGLARDVSHADAEVVSAGERR